MHNNATRRMVFEVKDPLLAVLTSLSSHSSKIRSSWRTLLKRCRRWGKYVSLLEGLRVAPQLRDVIFSDTEAYRETCEHQGEDLASRGVPVECVAVAVAFYVESCLPYLSAEEPWRVGWTEAFARWASIYQFFLLTGYARHEAAHRQLLEERISQADRRLQDCSIQLGETYEKVRRHLVHDLHDVVGNDLVVLKLVTEVIALDLKKGDMGHLRRKLKESITLIEHALKSVRHLTFDLGPPIWNEQDFVPAVRLYARQFAKRTGIKVRLDAARMRAQLPGRYETTLYKVLQGALSNVVSHADARRVKITLSTGRKSVAMKIEDDGRGFNVGRKMGVASQSYGLRAMRERVELLGGTIHFASQLARQRTDYRGTTIETHLPLQG